MKIVLFFLTFICLNTSTTYAENFNIRSNIPERVIILETAPNIIWNKYEDFISRTQKELLIVTPSIEGKKGIQPLEKLMGKTRKPKAYIIFCGISTRKDEGYKSANILNISSYFHPAVNDELNTFITSTFIIQDRKNVLVLSGMSLQEYKTHPLSSPLLIIIENDKIIANKFFEKYKNLLNNNAEEIKFESFKKQSLSLTREELWNSR